MSADRSAPALRVVFAGTPDFAATALQALLDSPHRVIAVYTQPDRPAGRGRKPQPSPVKTLAMAHDLPLAQPVSLRTAEARAALAALAPDVMVVAAYGLILPRAVLAIPRLGAVNIHASLLPRWRGAAPIQRALLAGDPVTGVSIMQMEAGLDTGPVLMRVSCPIGPEDTAGTLHDRLAALGARALLEALQALAAGRAVAEPQNEAEATYAPKLDKREARLDWGAPADRLERAVRAYNPWPVAYAYSDDTALRIWQARALPRTHQAAPGTVLAAGREGIDVACATGVLRLLRLQLPGGRILSAAELLNGRPELVGVGKRLA